MSKAGFAQAKVDADAQYKIDKEACSSHSANAKDICLAQAKGRDKVAKADAQAAYENTAEGPPERPRRARPGELRRRHREVRRPGRQSKDVCVKEAKAGLVKGKADAKVDRVAADTRQEGAAKRTEAREEANTEKRDAEFKVAIEKCDALAGPAKDSCVSGTKVQFGKS